MPKLKILFETWHGIPHSYGIVAAFLLIHFELYYSDQVEIYVREPKYFREHWNKCRGKWVYTEKYNKILESLKQYNPKQNLSIDIVYRQTYPYNLTLPSPQEPGLMNAKIVVFYTSEFANLDVEYFHIDQDQAKIMDDTFIRNYILSNKQLYFTSPSKWSDIGLVRFTEGRLEPHRNKIVTHGVDTTIYKKNKTIRKRIREVYNIKDDDIVLLNIGAMTQNKGIMEILILLAVLVFSLNKKNIKLMLKGAGDLYSCKEMIENYMTTLQQRGVLSSSDQIKELVSNHIIFTEQTLTCTRINDLYNSCDIYLSPYIAEGFNLTVLEAIAAGVPTIVSGNGSTQDFIDAITTAVPETKGTLIHALPTQIVTLPDQKQILQISIDQFIQTTINTIESLKDYREMDNYYPKLQQFLEENYSWKVVCDELIKFFIL